MVLFDLSKIRPVSMSSSVFKKSTLHFGKVSNWLWEMVHFFVGGRNLPYGMLARQFPVLKSFHYYTRTTSKFWRRDYLLSSLWEKRVWNLLQMKTLIQVPDFFPRARWGLLRSTLLKIWGCINLEFSLLIKWEFLKNRNLTSKTKCPLLFKRKWEF